MKKVNHMIEVSHISKDFVAPKKYPAYAVSDTL